MKSSGLALVVAAMLPWSLQSPPAAAQGDPITPVPVLTAQQVLATPTANWLTNGGNLFNQRHSGLTALNRDNVAGLKAVWRASLRGAGLDHKVSGQAQPLVYEGTIYTIAGNDDVFAVSVKSGQVLWEYQPHLDPAKVLVCCGWTSRGLGMGDGKIYVGQLDNRLVALDQRTGKVVWSVQSETHQDGGYSITSAPLYYEGMVIQGHAGGDMGSRGVLKAFDARTGHLRWRFYTIPGPGEPGHETWPADNDLWKYGGASIWQTPAVDPEQGLIIFSTDNPAPDLNGGVRAGDNLYSGCILALDAHTGKLRWYFQEIHHDIWDYSAPNPVVLFDVVIHGQPRKGVVEVSKDGYAYILDRTNGKPLIGIPERAVMQNASQHTSPTQPIPIGDDIVPHAVDAAPEGYDLINDGRTFTPFADKPVVYTPVGGVNWPPSSYDPAAHTLFVCANDGAGAAQRIGEKFEIPSIGDPFLGGAFGRVDAVRRGIVAAVDVTTNRLVWRRQWTDACGSGSVNTAGGLLFMGRGDGRFMAFDTRNGRALWEFQTDAPINAPATVFEYQGTEYVAVMAAGSFYSPRKHGDGLWLFALTGTLGPLPPGSASLQVNAAAATPPPSGPADLGHGRQVYSHNCEPCHGPSGLGGHGEGARLESSLTAAMVTTIVTTGRKDMPAFQGILRPEDLRDVAGYITQEMVPARERKQ
ncbi:MAG TPA: PQQ-binding-like beta-propeller repeat protein [Steroidobacteraceae bacterium]